MNDDYALVRIGLRKYGLTDREIDVMNALMNHSAKGLTHQELTQRAFNTLIDTLRGYGSTPSEGQRKALAQLLASYTLMAQGYLKGRFAFPLATGLGKTQSIVAWLATLYSLGHGQVSLAVCASKVEALCDLKRDLVRSGIPDERIGLLHSYHFDEAIAENYLKQGVPLPQGYASEDCTSGEDRQILLVTHNRVRGRGDIQRFNQFNGRPRDLLIWDESLFISESRSLVKRHLEKAVNWLEPDLAIKPRLQPAFDYLKECLAVLDEELRRQREGESPRTLPLRKLSHRELREFNEAIGTSRTVEPLRSFLEIGQADLRAMTTPQGSMSDAVVYYDIVVPEELENIIVLDASHTIRKLVKLDKSIQTSIATGDVVAYRNVVVHQLRHHSGRHTMTTLFKVKQDNRQVSKEIVEVIQTIPANEGVLLFTFKERDGIDFVKILKRDFQAHGLDVEATLPDGKKRFAWLTWGNETSLSKFSYCKNVIFAGVLHLPDLAIAASMIGQTDNLLQPVCAEDVRQIRESEIVHCLYQGMARGSCRILKDGVAQAMNVWLIHKSESIRKPLNQVMPGLQWKEWTPKYLVSKGKIKEVAEKVLGFLQETELTKVSTSKVKQVLGLKEVPNQTFKEAVKVALGEAYQWILEGRSLVKITAQYYGL